MKRALISTMVLQYPYSNIDYVAAGRKMVSSYLKHTPHHVYIATNKPEAFNDIKEEYGERFIISHMPSKMNKYNGFDYTLKLDAIAQASTANVDCLYWVDADHYTTGWHEESFQECVAEEEFDIINGSGTLHKRSQQYWNGDRIKGDHVPLEGEGCLWSMGEGQVIYNNMDTLRKMVELWKTCDWDTWLKLNPKRRQSCMIKGAVIEDWRTKEGADGMLIGTAFILTEGSYKDVHEDEFEFAKYERQVKKVTFNRSEPELVDRWNRPVAQ